MTFTVRSTRLAALLVAMAAVVPPAAAGDGDVHAPVADVVTRVYDLGVIQLDGASEHEWLEVLPFRLSRYWDEDLDYDRYEHDSNLGEMLGMLLWDQLASDEFSLETRQVDLLDGDRLLVTASEGVHRQLQTLLDAFAAALHRTAAVETEVWKLRGVLADPVSSDQLDALVTAGRLELLSRHTEELFVGRTDVQRSERSHAMVRDWDVEIAQGAATASPEIQQWSSGTVRALRLEDDLSGGYRLRWFQRISEVVDWIERQPDSRGTITTDQALVNQRTIGKLDQPLVAVVTVAGSNSLAPGESFVVAARTTSSQGPVGYLLRYRLVSVEAAAEAVSLTGTPATEIRLVDTSSLRWPAMTMPSVDRVRLLPTSHHDMEQLVIAPIGFPSSDWSDDWNGREFVDQILYDGEGRGFHWQLDDWFVMGGPTATLDRCVEAMQLFTPKRDRLRVEVWIDTHARRFGEGASLAQVAVPVEQGQSAFALAGFAGLALWGYDVDVAHNAASADPLPIGFFDGLSVRATGLGAVAAQVDVCLHLLSGREQVELGAAIVGGRDRLTFDTLQLSRRVPADGREHRFGGLGPDPSSGAVREIVVRVTPD